MMRRKRRMWTRALLAAGLAAACGAALMFGQTQVKTGFNIFSVEQDIEIGRQSAAEAERQLPIVDEPSVERYVDAIGRRLAAVAPGPKFPYQFRVVNLSDINAFALPGGYLYVNRGLIEAARSEGELAGVLAHEIAHVALRHGTNQASKAYLAQAGVGILGGLLGGGSDNTRGIVEALGGFGLNALFLKYSRTAEEQADIVGTQMLARAGYDPVAMATMFEMLKTRAGRDPGKLEQFFSSHPAPANREARVRKEASLMGSPRPTAPVGRIEQAKSELARLPAAPTMAQVARGEVPRGRSAPPDRGAVAGIAAPSTRFRNFRQRGGFFEIQHPENWRAVQGRDGYGVTFVPDGGWIDRGGQQVLIYGVVVNHYDPFEGSIGSVFEEDRGHEHARSSEDALVAATDDLVREVRSGNPHLRPTTRAARRQKIDEGRALSIVLAGRSPVTGEEERVTVFTRELPDGHVLYSLFIAPGKDYATLSRTFQHMISSLRVDDRAAHN